MFFAFAIWAKIIILNRPPSLYLFQTVNFCLLNLVIVVMLLANICVLPNVMRMISTHRPIASFATAHRSITQHGDLLYGFIKGF